MKPLTVSEYIKLLQKFDPDFIVVENSGCGCCTEAFEYDGPIISKYGGGKKVLLTAPSGD